MRIRLLPLALLLACGGTVEAPAPEAGSPVDAPSDTGRPDVAPDAPDAPDGQPDAACKRCVGDTWYDVCPATPMRQPDAESCLYCGGHCDGG